MSVASELLEAQADVARLKQELRRLQDDKTERLTAAPVEAWLPRPIVRHFAGLMEERLVANEHRGGWKREHPQTLLQGMFECSRHLETAVGRTDTREVARHAANVANYAMMVADVCGALEEEPKRERSE